MSYVGRFAPSPTGRLHLGSLLAALASFLDARHQQGRWYVRIEDLDPLREQPGANDDILRTLECLQLHWDGTVEYQSQRHQHYEATLDRLSAQGRLYPCVCSRREVKQRGAYPVYDRHCLSHPPGDNQPSALRLLSHPPLPDFVDGIQGAQNGKCAVDDVILRRRDGLFAYQLAVVVDDHLQGITHVVRGADLIAETPRQLHLQQLLGYAQPHYAHIPLACHQGQKLSKQNLAPALNPATGSRLLTQALTLLGQALPADMEQAPVHELLAWATTHWQLARVPACLHLEV